LKRWLRSAGVQAFLGWALTGYLQLILRTVRWRHENLDAVEPTLAGSGPAIALVWHGRLPLCLSIAPQWGRRDTRALISPSADGEFIAQALARAGFPAIRGSSAKKGADAAKTRGASAAFRETLSWLKGGGALVITPDGPRGPNEVIARGAIPDRRTNGRASVHWVGIAARPALRVDTWDRPMIGLPFGRGAVVWDGPLARRAGDEGGVQRWSRTGPAAPRRPAAAERCSHETPALTFMAPPPARCSPSRLRCSAAAPPAGRRSPPASASGSAAPPDRALSVRSPGCTPPAWARACRCFR
jgi:lysophospholipid acyltransferase (LPLAT)-like uncharacterized protein